MSVFVWFIIESIWFIIGSFIFIIILTVHGTPQDRIRDVAVDIAACEADEDAAREREVADVKAKEQNRQADRSKEEAIGSLWDPILYYLIVN